MFDIVNIVVSFFAGHWLAVAILAPMFWALVNIIDVYFVDGIYKSPSDGVIISGFFQVLVWPFLFLIFGIRLTDIGAGLSLIFLNYNVALVCCLSGIFYALSVYFYYKALFCYNDAPMLQILWNFTVLAVPIMAFVFFNEALPALKYAGMAVCFIGATMLSLDKKIRMRLTKEYISAMSGAVLFLSFSMVLQEKVYTVFGEAFGEKGFWIGFFFFGVGFLLAATSLVVFWKRHPFALVKKYYKTLLVLEGFYFLGILFSQRALDAAPSASYVAAVETFVPVFVLAYSALILFVFKFIFKEIRKDVAIERIYTQQIAGVWLKILATLIMSIGIFLIS